MALWVEKKQGDPIILQSEKGKPISSVERNLEERRQGRAGGSGPYLRLQWPYISVCSLQKLKDMSLPGCNKNKGSSHHFSATQSYSRIFYHQQN